MDRKTVLPRESLTWLLPLVLLIGINLVIGAITVQNYGESIDEARLSEYADQSLSAYKSWLQPSYQPNFGGDTVQYYGPAYLMGIALTIKLLGAKTSSVTSTNLWHLAHFITFQFAVFCLYVLGRRWLSNWAAFGAALLFSTQPLLWGHGFINPQDMPFMAFFLASVTAGLWMNDRVLAPDEESFILLSIRHLITQTIQNWRRVSLHSKWLATTVSIFWLLSLVILVFGKNLLNEWIADFVQKLYMAGPQSLAGQLFAKLASNANRIPVDNYVHKAQTLFVDIKIAYVILSFIIIIWLYRAALPWGIRLPAKKAILAFAKRVCSCFIDPAIIVAGVLLGLATSIRLLGPLAGLIVCLHAFQKARKKALAPLLAYVILAALVMYLTWPSLWSNPVSHLIDSIKIMSAYPWLGQVLFDGRYYFPNNLPRLYLPVLFSIQFTEPVLILFWIGCATSGWNFIHHNNAGPMTLAAIWFFVPVFLIIITYRPLYDNFRQLLFLVPPIFILCGVALDALFRVVKKWRRFCQVTLLFILILPGVYNGLKLHPYEYIYYNSLVGGTGGAFRRFETDYWMTSSREVANFLSQTAQPFSKIVVDGPSNLVSKYARQDLIIEPEQGGTYGSYDYAVLFSRYDHDQFEFTNNKPVFIVQRDGAVLAVVKSLSLSSFP